MPESYSVRAILSAKDQGFTSLFNKANDTTESLFSKIKSGLGFGALMSAGQKAFDTISDSATGLISDLNESSAAWKTFEGNMGMLGKSADDITSVRNELQEFATQTIYSASDMATTYSQLEAVGIKSTNKLVKGFGGLAAAAAEPQQAMKTLSMQAVQMAAKPKVAWEDFKLMLEQTPAGIAAVAKYMGKTTSQLVKDVQDGKIKTEEFFDAITAVGTNDAFSKLATEYKTVGQAADGLKETLSVKLAPAFDTVSKIGIDSISGIIEKLDEVDAEGLSDKFITMVNVVKPYWDSLSSNVARIAKSAGGAISSLASAFGELAKNKDVINGFATAIDYAGDALVTFFDFIGDNADTIVAVTPYVAGLGLAFKSYKIIKSIVPGVASFTASISKLAGQKLQALATRLLGTATAQKAVGTASQTSGKQILASAAAFVAIGAGVALASAGLSLLVYSAIQLTNSGPGAIAVMAGLTAALAGLAVGASVLGPTLTAGAVGFVAFGGAIALVGTGALLAGAALAIVSASLPTLVEYGISGAASIAVLGASMLAFGAGAVVAAAGSVALGAGLVVVGAGAVVAAAGIVALGAAVLVTGAGLLVAAAGASVLGPAILIIASGGLVAATSMLALSAGIIAFTAGAVAGTAAFVALSAGLIAGTASMVAFTASLVAVTAGMVALAAGLLGVLGSMKSIQSSAKSTANSLKSMKSSISFVNSALEGLGSLAKSAMKSLINAFDDTESEVKTSGKNIGTGLTQGVKSGTSQLPVVANQSVLLMVITLQSAQSQTYNAGVYIGKGLVNGLRSTLGEVRTVAGQLASAAEAAIRAKAKIHSPSKVSTSLGEYWGGGFVNGIISMRDKAKSAAKNLLGSFSNKTAKISLAGINPSLDSDYNYTSDKKYVFEIPFYLDNKKFAEATAEYTEEEIEKQNKLKKLIMGVK